jgi:hypothetical protein
MTDDPYFEEDRMFGYMVACARCGATGNSEIFYLEEEDEDVDYLIDIIKSIEKKEAKAEADMKKKQEKHLRPFF